MFTDNMKIKMEGHVVITDSITKEILLDVWNHIHYENMSEAIALSLANIAEGHIHELHFGNGGTTINGTGAITYFPANVTGQNADLYNRTYFKVIDNQSSLNTDIINNNIVVRHTAGKTFTDIIVTCTLNFNEPANQEAFDDTSSTEGDFVFDEIGLKSFNTIPGTGKLLSHVIFSPFQKSLNRQIQIEYTIRISMC